MKYFIPIIVFFCFGCKSSTNKTLSFKYEDYVTVSKISDGGKLVTEIKANRNNQTQLMKINYYANGRISTMGFYIHDTLSGPYTLYKENGAVFLEAFYKGGKRDGRWIRRNDSGKIDLIEVYRNDSLISISGKR
jgi:antitoxin component YwqK of YwqJK toxin-antitoxin module